MARVNSSGPPAGRPEMVRAAGRPIRVLIVDDSLVARTIITRMLTSDDFEIVATASDAQQAIELLRVHQVDIVLLDVEMPGMDGLTALPHILEASGGARVLVVSSACAEGASASVKALTLGAADTLLKPSAGSFAGVFGKLLVDRLLRIGHAPHLEPRSRATSTPVEAAPERGPIECLAIGASTGGLHALSAFFAALPAEFDAPILITQHLPAEFMPYFANQLQDMSNRPATVASDGSRLLPGHLLIAPGDAHMRLIRFRDGVRARLDRTPAASGCMPSVDPMFASCAEMFGSSAVAVVLSGMGRDGSIGAADIVAAGGQVIAQDAETAVVWGMPGAVSNAGLASAVLPPDRLAQLVGWRSRTAMAGRSWR